MMSLQLLQRVQWRRSGDLWCSPAGAFAKASPPVRRAHLRGNVFVWLLLDIFMTVIHAVAKVVQLAKKGCSTWKVHQQARCSTLGLPPSTTTGRHLLSVPSAVRLWI